MHDIEPFFRWRHLYQAEQDKRSPFYRKVYDEFGFTNAIYNYYIHPQWDNFGSSTLYLKILYTDYELGCTIIELIGEWNDTLHDDIMYLKRNIAEYMQDHGIFKFMLICDNVLNFHSGDNLYLDEWSQEVREEGGWICCINLLDHVFADFEDAYLQRYLFFADEINEIEWRQMKPDQLITFIDSFINHSQKSLEF
ncbi:MAG TPA: hypothetical protein DCX89_03295 [Saprospirales bacterium]|nr:hypothetical protein [Saprospirales bacterium]HAY70891.1 hypothetical protein [Saprospirales bacterium]HRQ29609.1 hypothetical protein [Saprospiraceae bacterium]